MAKPDANKLPLLKQAWDAYGHAVKWDDLIDIKMRSDRCYCVVAWRTPDDMVECADLYRTDIAEDWEFNNDGGEPLTKAQWRNVSIIPHCDAWQIKGK